MPIPSQSYCIMNQINFNNEIYFETPYDKYYISKTGTIISLKHKNIRTLSYKTDNDGYFNITLSLGHRDLKYIRVSVSFRNFYRFF